MHAYDCYCFHGGGCHGQNLTVTLLPQTKVARNPKYVPDFSKAFAHLLVHPGAKIVIDQVCCAKVIVRQICNWYHLL